jgi:hypothetical protein
LVQYIFSDLVQLVAMIGATMYFLDDAI